MSANKLLRHGTVITFNETTNKIKILRRASVLIIQDRIAAIEEEDEDNADPSLILSRHSGATGSDLEVVDCRDKIISPGFINTHVHSWQAAYRSATPDITLSAYFSWVSQQSHAATTAFTPADVYISALEAYLEGLHAGVTGYVEHAHCNWHPDVIRQGFEAAVDSGARIWWCYDVFEREGFEMQEQWRVLEELGERPRPDRLELGLAMDGLSHEFMSKPKETLVFFKERIEKLKLKAITMHYLGGPWPALEHSPSRVCECDLHTTNIPIILSHAGFLTDADMAALRKHDLNVSITPESECHYGHGQVIGRQISDQASLGTDTPFTFSGDLITQARLWLQVVRNTSYEETLTATPSRLPRETPMAVEQAFLLATRQGGRALRRDDLGVLKVGAKADLVVFGGESPNMLGWSDPVAAIVLHANASDVEHVMVDGEWKKFEGRLVNLKVEWKEVCKRFKEAAVRIQQVVREQGAPKLEGKLWGRGEFGDVHISTTIRAD